MSIEFLATIVAAFFGAGIGLMIRKLTRQAAPKWVVPVMAGLGMIFVSVWQEYDWYPRLEAGMPQGAVIAQTGDVSAPLRPWTYLFPMINEAYVVDTRRNLRNPANPDILVTQVLHFKRWNRTRDALVAFDCANSARVGITAEVAFSETGEMSGGTWVPLPKDDRILRAACDGG